MSAITDVQKTAAPFDDETPTANITRHFKTTEENKTETVTISLNENVQEFLTDLSLRSARWRSFGQLVNDAIIYYLNTDEQVASVDKIIDGASWSTDNQKGAAITKTLYDQIELLVKHGHTQWNTKQEFYICALFCYVGDDFPIVERR